ncbi:hypothetical protein [Cellulomonas iranensis]|uniref:HicB family protein n=1 Tax=Cellulomonas iranensis TaxID=76862 RepID=A0ABU0GG11_9CELL|nr:hypothetical protein [Cellulomonas iranensis]MDQ0424286.1 hypothetical protein [Cellulomonas iranensis]
MSSSYTATVTQDGRWWTIVVPGVGVTQACRLSDAEDAARELVAAGLDIPLESVNIDVVAEEGA